MLPDWIRTEQYTAGNEVTLLYSGKPFFDALEACIRGATRTLHVQVYILNPDETGLRVLELLCDAARRGVAVYLLLDAYGSMELGKARVEAIRQAGVQVRFFGRLFSKNLSLGRRLHHKIVVADARDMLIGGINFADRYNEVQGQPPWLDFGARLQGPLAAYSHKRCVQLWERRRWTRYRPFPGTAGGALACLSANDWLRGRQEITSRLRYVIRHARQELILGAAYFVPTAGMLHELRKAARRGVRVRLLLGRYSDVGLALRATRFLYDWLLRQGMEIYEFKEGILHAKIAVADACWASIGSYNLNFLSAFESLELNLDVADAPFALQVTAELETILETRCERILPEAHPLRQTLAERIGNALAFVALWLTAYVVSFFDRRKERT